MNKSNTSPSIYLPSFGISVIAPKQYELYPPPPAQTFSVTKMELTNTC